MPGIIVGVEGAGHSPAALDRAVREASDRHAPLTVITVHQPPVEYLGSAVDNAQDHDLAERSRQATEDAVGRTLARAGQSRPESVTVRAAAGTPADVLIDAARDADLLVVGSRGAGRLAQLLMGSVSRQVSRQAGCPVIVVPAPGRG
jgi:nucleotide-binding universal stress UspA family protein